MPPEKSLALGSLSSLEKRLFDLAGMLVARVDAALGGHVSAAARSLSAPAVALALPILAGTVSGVAIAYFMVQPAMDDQTWYLYAAGRLLHGARLYGADVMETNPPLIIWLSAIPMGLASLTGMLPTLAFRLCMALLIAGSIGWSLRLIRRSTPALSWQVLCGFVVTLVYMLAVYPWPDRQTWSLFGQREHILVLLVLPYLVMAAGRLEGRPVHGWEGIAVGFVAGIGLCLKPHQLLIVAGVEVLQFYRSRDLRALVRPELVALALAGVVYCAGIWVFAPGYITTVLPLLLQVYGQVGSASLGDFAAPDRVLKMVSVLVICVLLCRHAKARSLIAVLLVAACGAATAFIVQHKGWAYQFLPAQILFRASVCLLAIDLALQWVGAPPVAMLGRRSVAAALAAVSGLIAVGVTYPAKVAWVATTWDEDITAGFTESFGEFPRGTPVYFMSPSLQAVFAIVTDSGYVWSSRFPHLWPLPAILHNEAGVVDPKKQLPPDRVESLARQLRSDLVEDFRRWQPAVVMVERCNANTWVCYNLEGLKNVDLARWFARDPAFAEIWSHYTLRRTFVYYDVYVRDTAVRQ